MIFHAPFDVGAYHSKSASGIRPQRMLEAFRDAGFDVFLVTGGVRERKVAIAEVKRQIRNGDVFDFVYSESTTKPHIFTGRYQYPLNPFFDYAFFRFCRKNNVPVSLFYRDVYWRFKEFREDLGVVKANILRPFYIYDLLQYKRAIDVLYVPSDGYAEQIPSGLRPPTALLPPGGEIVGEVKEVPSQSLLYIGGLGSHYTMHEAFSAVADDPTLSLTVCTREPEWDLVEESYQSAANISVVHKSGQQLDSLYEEARYCLIFMESSEYRKFAVPFKLYEYIGRGKPIIASSGTYAGKVVEELGVGWTIPYDAQALADLLHRIENEPGEYRETLTRLRLTREENTWEKRAQQVAADMALLRNAA